MTPCITSLILGGFVILMIGDVPRPDKWLEVSFAMFIIGLILFPFIYIIIYNILPKNPGELV